MSLVHGDGTFPPSLSDDLLAPRALASFQSNLLFYMINVGRFEVLAEGEEVQPASAAPDSSFQSHDVVSTEHPDAGPATGLDGALRRSLRRGSSAEPAAGPSAGPSPGPSPGPSAEPLAEPSAGPSAGPSIITLPKKKPTSWTKALEPKIALCKKY